MWYKVPLNVKKKKTELLSKGQIRAAGAQGKRSKEEGEHCHSPLPTLWKLEAPGKPMLLFLHLER